ncbi:MAG: T9SS type A sorting domain-containing protein [Bacteroidota bacterium]
MNYYYISRNICAALLFSNTLMIAQDGNLDVSFNTTGMVTTSFGDSRCREYGKSIVIQSDGKIVVAGYSDDGSISDFAVVRYLVNGSVDADFGTGGKVITDFENGTDVATAACIQNGNKIVVAGNSFRDGNNYCVLARYNSNGTLDSTFGILGKVTTLAVLGADYITGISVQNDGKLAVSGYSYTGSLNEFMALRYTMNGSLDTAFSIDGKVTTSVGIYPNFGMAIALQNDGKIVIGGYAFPDGITYDFALLRYNVDGTIDSGFGINGMVTTDFDTNNEKGYAIAIQGDGKIVLVGSSNYDGAIVRFLSNGTVDTSFGSFGLVTTDFGNIDESNKSIVLQLNGKIVVTGYSGADIIVARYETDGTLDIEFGTSGKVVTDFGGSNDGGNSAVIQSAGQIVVAGESDINGSVDFAVVRYTGSSAPLPVELSSFSVQSRQNGISLEWRTETETDNYGFEIERRAQHKSQSVTQWEKIGFVEGAGTTNAAKTYSFIDVHTTGNNLYRLKLVDRNGNFSYSPEVGTLGQSIPRNISLHNFPNPFNPSTTIRYSLPSSSHVKLTVHDILGREIATLVNEEQSAGWKEVQWNARHASTGSASGGQAKDVSSGIYFYRLTAGSFIETKKMLLVR